MTGATGRTSDDGAQAGHPDLARFHDRFIPDDPDQLALPARLAVGIGLGVVTLAAAFICMNTLNSLGVWVTLLLVSVLTASAAVAWIWDTFRGPTEGDETAG